MRTLVLGGGCFWCLDALYREVRGVTEVTSGYTGGRTPHPTYESVCSGRTGHAEAVRVSFDESVIPASVILDMFFAMHDPTTLNRQGYDVGTQYRSAVFAASERDAGDFEAARERAARLWDDPIVTALEPLGEFFEAEPIHQNYYAEFPDAGYCQVIVNPKLSKARRAFEDWIRPQPA
ncbi:peptide-methionine (S)-S-oxide reductase MsrA [Arthrobacter sp. UM1]|uniref:peptide-methionine (S)-S-oxide reductase MsrA n=1 Tax=Arthrobacter sp. UM1 TaxID=2766776 RepID=UPI001CF6C0D6|nr:peptide-methionine (S)-S-oxide reductase MsrA [Arthrobacter sp. UM1]MCB4207346.1 peptide-methionine (S)-S-oxide reductase MsrA [Arthrobacter sp. UM1]